MFAKLPILVPLVAFLGIVLTAGLVYWAWRSRRAAAFEDLRRRLGGIPLDQGALSSIPGRLNTVSGPLGKFLDETAIQAGSDITAARLLVQIVLYGGVGALGGLVLSRSPLGLGGVVLALAPIGLLRRAATQRDALLTVQLPDALDLIGRAMRAGHALTDALRISACEMPAPIGTEFTRVSEENRMGRGLRESLSGLNTRNPQNFDLRLFMSVVMLQRETGGNLAEILDSLAHTIRERVVFKEKVKALTAEVSMSATVLTAMPFLVAALLVCIQPTYLLPLIQDPFGRELLTGAVVSLLLGVRIMKSLTNVAS